MRLARLLGNRIERIFEYLGLVDPQVTDDPLACALAPYVAPSRDPLGSIFDKLRTRDGCPHWHSLAVDDAPFGPAKTYHCPDCGLTYCEVTSPSKPWLVIDYREVTYKPRAFDVAEPNAGFGA